MPTQKERRLANLNRARAERGLPPLPSRPDNVSRSRNEPRSVYQALQTFRELRTHAAHYHASLPADRAALHTAKQARRIAAAVKTWNGLERDEKLKLLAATPHSREVMLLLPPDQIREYVAYLLGRYRKVTRAVRLDDGMPKIEIPRRSTIVSNFTKLHGRPPHPAELRTLLTRAEHNAKQRHDRAMRRYALENPLDPKLPAKYKPNAGSVAIPSHLRRKQTVIGDPLAHAQYGSQQRKSFELFLLDLEEYTERMSPR